jgi:hypothetical protein
VLEEESYRAPLRRELRASRDECQNVALARALREALTLAKAPLSTSPTTLLAASSKASQKRSSARASRVAAAAARRASSRASTALRSASVLSSGGASAGAAPVHKAGPLGGKDARRIAKARDVLCVCCGWIRVRRRGLRRSRRRKSRSQ